MGIFKKNPIKSLKNFGEQLFAKFFGFEQGIDITNDIEVLRRRNVVIKNIIFVSNLAYSALLLILSLIGSPTTSDWIITFLSVPITYMINKVLKTLINIDHNDRTKQMLAAYVAAFYIFFSSFLIYFRLYTKGSQMFETVSYILIYYAVVVISLYQDKRLLSTAFQFILVLITIIHFIVTYNLAALAEGKTMVEFLNEFIKMPEFSDLILRTLFFILFYFVVYSIVSIGQYMQEERKKELVKRRAVQADFVHIVGDLFQAVFTNSVVLVNKKHALLVQKIAMKLADYYGLSEEKKANLNEFSMVHLKYEEVRTMTIDAQNFDDKAYDNLKQRTALGAYIVKRIELSQKCESIVRAHIENNIDEEFINGFKKTQNNIQEQIILLSDVYVTLRSAFSYKRPLSHSNAIKQLESNLSRFFHYELKERFIKFEDEFEEIYNNFEMK